MRKLIATTFVLTLLCLCTAPLWAQSVIQVEAGQNSILDAMAEAQPGDIIELTDGGVYYMNDDELRIEMPLTIRAAAGLNERPILYNNGDDGTKDIIRLYNSLRLEGIEIDGFAPDSTVKYAIRTCDDTNCAEPGFDLFVIDSYIHDIVHGSDGNAFRLYGGAGSGPDGEFPFADSIVFRNTDIHNTGKQAIRVGLESGYSGLSGFGFYNANYFEFTNGTITDSKKEAIGVYGGGMGDEMGEGTVVRINHLTCNNCGYDGSRAVYPWDAYDTEVKNSVFTNSPGGDYVVRLYGPQAVATYIDTMNVAGISTAKGATVEDPVFNLDPTYVDASAPANELRYADNSPILDLADDGLALGDVELAGQTLGGGGEGGNVIQVSAAQNSILDAIDEAQPGDIIELTDGGVYYMNDDELRIEMPLTIRAAAGLNERPILYNNGDDGTKDIIRLYNSLRLEGIEIDGFAPDSTVKYAIRTCDDTNCAEPGFDLFVIDSYIHDIVHGSDGNAFRLYGGAGSGPNGEFPFADSIVFRNTNIHNTGKQAIRVGLESGYSGLSGFGFYNANYFEFTNGTITDSKKEAIGVYGGGMGDEMGEGTVVRINHLTCNNCGYDGSRAVYPWDAYDTIVKNSVFTNSPGGDYVVRLYGPEAVATYIDTMNVAGISTAKGATVEDPVFSVDPAYVDAGAPAGELRYADNSPVVDMADDDMALGDVRLAGQDPALIGGFDTAIEQVDSELPAQMMLRQNYPNPFNPTTTIPFELEQQGTATLTVYDMLGRAVTTLVDEKLAAGSYKATFNAQGLASGVYLYVLNVNGKQVRKNMVLMK